MKPLHLQSLSISNFACFDTFEMTFSSPADPDKGSWTVLLGDNGVGKSTLLRAIASTCHDVGQSNKSTAHGGEVRVVSSAGIHQQAGGAGYAIPPALWNLYAYGTSRGSAVGGPSRSVDFRSPLGPVSTLFRQPPGLLHAETWLRDLERGALKGGPDERAFFDAVVTTLLSLLPGIDHLELPTRGPAIVRGPSVGEVPLESLSDGYLTTFGWVADLVARWSEQARDRNERLQGDFSDRMTGLVLVDEIDLHLHPRWQRHVIDDLRAAFPKLSFVVTTHNPLTLHGAQPGEVHVLQRQADGTITSEQIDARPGLDTDDLLTGRWFGLATTLDQDTVEQLTTYQQSLDTASEEDRVELESLLIERLGGTQQLTKPPKTFGKAAAALRNRLRKS